MSSAPVYIFDGEQYSALMGVWDNLHTLSDGMLARESALPDGVDVRRLTQLLAVFAAALLDCEVGEQVADFNTNPPKSGRSRALQHSEGQGGQIQLTLFE